MPIEAFVPLMQSGVNALSSLFTNSAQKKLSLEMYDRQRADALADWNRQNQYNSPAAQMARFKEAGLSPHLIYGQTNTAPAVRSSTLDTPKLQAPQIDTSVNPILTALQIENTKKQGALMDAQAIKLNSETEWKNLNTKYLEGIIPYKTEQEFQRGNLLGAQYRTELQNTELRAKQREKMEADIRNTKLQASNIIAQTALSQTKKSELLQMIENLKVTQRLLGEKVKTEEYQNQIQQKIQSFGVAGSTLAALLRLFK